MTVDPQHPNETPTHEASSPLPPRPDADVATREAYKKKLDARLDQWQAKLDQMMAKSREAKADASIEARSAIDDAKQKLEAFREEADRFKNSGKDAWEELAQGCEASWTVFKDAASRATRHF